jgi:hypothetical protein
MWPLQVLLELVPKVGLTLVEKNALFAKGLPQKPNFSATAVG